MNVTLCARGAWGGGKDEVGDCPGLCSERPHGSSNVWKEVKMGDVTLQVLKMEEGLLTATKSGNGFPKKWGSPFQKNWVLLEE